MKKPKNWCTKSYLKKVKSTEIIVKKKSLDFIPQCIEIYNEPAIIENDKILIGTPKRELIMLTPDGIIKIKGDEPDRRNYRSIRKITF